MARALDRALSEGGIALLTVPFYPLPAPRRPGS